ncbi:MAG TPA: hypothetical protein VF142_23685 [Longimicrobium sp.]
MNHLLRHGLVSLAALLALGACQDAITPPELDGPALAKGSPGRPPGGGETAGSNLSFPTIWAEGVSKNPRGTMGTVALGGAWWWWWGEALVEGGDPLACAPDPDDNALCDDRIPFQSNGPPPGAGAVRSYLQKDALNEWQADNASGVAAPVTLDWIDWGDALESVAWTLTSKVRVETTLYQDLDVPMTGYQMRHVSGHGIDEMWGVESAAGAAATYASPQALVFSPCARLTIQKLLVPREQLALPPANDARLVWNPATHAWTEDRTLYPQGELISDLPVFNGVLAAEGPGGGFGAEINIQGKVVYGMTWDVRKMNDGAADYRLTFSLADDNCAASLNTFITSATQIVQPTEEEGASVMAEPATGGTAVVHGDANLTYIDIRITPRTTGGGKGGGGGGGGGGGPRR